MTLRDAVRTADNTVSKHARELARISSNRSAPQLERIRAFSEIIDREIGDTWLRRSRGLERDFDQGKLYLKFEGDNPTGTQKDRIAFAHVEEALSENFDRVALATCGNYGVAVALAAYLAGLHCEIFIPAGYHSKRIEEMERLGAKLHRPVGTYEDTVAISRQWALERGCYDANPGGDNTDLQLRAYAQIANEITQSLATVPDRIAVPVSNGTLLAGIFSGFERLLKNGHIDKLPRMIGASSIRKNPIVTSFLAGSRRCIDLDPASIKETSINEPLINWHSFDGQEALNAIHESGGGAWHVTDEQMRKMSSYLSQKEALQVLPASTAGLIALTAEESDHSLQIAVLTAKR
ncbi:threonine synthase-related protein [Neolewinella xylanilytica]|uniref:Threonine synthase-related protein n=1 Tax=Neolewinella xylanilytica TaxID=1514080 RepID=A0A2S6I5Z6_9BACT|nr:pyridoxal-phosphate dependent enzyme [Neolewinella xylanilytica]PPK86531.1 threonine synthase-related protein [Neolewinella xylanilytica]